ncbi:MAG: hypothetical protein ACT4O0_05175 [Pseudonocardia sp.]|jgi:hypothetical protein
MSRTATLAEPTTDWRQFDDRAAREDAIGADLTGALNEPGF